MSAPSGPGSSAASAAAAQAQANASALQIALSHLQGALTYNSDTNIETNKKLWNEYARNYKEKQQQQQPASDAGGDARPSEWVLDMAGHVARDASQLHFLGDEWSDEAALAQALDEFLFPTLGIDRLHHHVWRESGFEQAAQTGRGIHASISYLPTSLLAGSPSDLTVAEIGVGGGRIAARVYPHVKHLHAFDISENMLATAQESIYRQHAAATRTPEQPEGVKPSNISFHLLTSAPQFPPKLHGQCDVVYCFDVMPHIDLHTIYGYFKSIKQLLRPNPTPEENRPRPRIFLHTANLCAPLGFERFSKQSKFTAGGFYFLSPEIIHQLARQTGYRIIQQSRCADPTQDETAANAPEEFRAAREARKKNLYYQRDFLFVMEVI